MPDDLLRELKSIHARLLPIVLPPSHVRSSLPDSDLITCRVKMGSPRAYAYFLCKAFPLLAGKPLDMIYAI